MKLRSLMTAAVLFAAVPVAGAENVMPEVVYEPEISSVPGRAIDLRGMVPGMAAQDVRNILRDILGAEPRETTERTVLSGSGVMVTGAPFTKWLAGTVDDEKITAMFSGISSDNRLVMIEREASYGDSASAPVSEDFLAGLTEKYGEPSFRKEVADATGLFWTFKDGRLVPCDDEGRTRCVNPTVAFTNLESAAADFDVIIFAAVGKSGVDGVRVSRFWLSATDLDIKVAADSADEEGLRPALEAAVAESYANAPKPAF